MGSPQPLGEVDEPTRAISVIYALLLCNAMLIDSWSECIYSTQCSRWPSIVRAASVIIYGDRIALRDDYARDQCVLFPDVFATE